jgi:Uma2 family endonuclease
VGQAIRLPYTQSMATKTLFTIEEFDALPEDGCQHELNQGELVTMTLPMPRHNRVIRRIQLLIEWYLAKHPVGELFFPDTPFVLSRPGEPATLRGPDLAFLSMERAAGIDPDRKIEGAPDLAIEVVSPSDRGTDLLEKTTQYLKAGGTAVWIVYPEEREVRVFEASGAIRILRNSDILEAPNLLPGFSTPVDRFFE